MPNYGSVAGVHALYPRIGSVSTVTSDTVTTFINHSEAKIHGFIGSRYNVPVPGGPPLLKYVTESLATALILRRFFSQEQENKSDWVVGMFEEVKDTLTGLSNGSIVLVNSSSVIIAPSRLAGTVWSSTQGYNPTMNILDPIQQRVDRRHTLDVEQSLAGDGGGDSYP